MKNKIIDMGAGLERNLMDHHGDPHKLRLFVWPSYKETNRDAGLPENHQVIGKYFEMMSGMIGEDNVVPER